MTHTLSFTAALAMHSSHILTHTLSFTAALAIHTLRIIFLLETCTSPFYVLRHTIYLTLAVAVPTWKASSLNMCSVELPGWGVVSMNNVILAKWRIALRINIGMLENH